MRYVKTIARSGDLVPINPGYDLRNALGYYSRRGDIEEKPFPSETNIVDEESLDGLGSVAQEHDRWCG